MDINLNNVSAASAAAAAAAAAAEAGELIVPQPETAGALLQGAGVTISETKGSSDIEKLAALLNQQTNNAREKSVVTTLASLGEAFATFAKQTQEAILQISDEVVKLAKAEKELKDLTGKLEEAKADLTKAEKAETAAMTAKDSATDELNALEKSKDESDEDFAARKTAAEQAVTDAGTALSNATKVKNEAQGKVTSLEGRVKVAADVVAVCEKKITSLYDALDFGARSKLTEALRMSASETPNGNPLNPEEDDEEDDAVKAELNAYKTPIEILREVLEKHASELGDDISKKIEPNV